MYNYQNKLYKLIDELTEMNNLLKGDYDIPYVNKWLLKSFKEDIKPSEFYLMMEKEYKEFKKRDCKLYHTVATILIYC